MSTYNFRLAQNKGMSEEDETHYRNLVVKNNLICQTLYSASMDEHMWQWATLEMGGKNKISYKCFNKDQNNYNDTTALVKAFCHRWNSLKQEAAQREGYDANMQTAIDSTSWSYEAGVHLELNKVSVKIGANSSPSLDVWCMNCCTTPEIPCIHNLMWKITFRWRPYGTSKTSWSYATQYGWTQWLSEEQYFIYMEA